MEVRDRGDVPGVAGQGTCQKTGCVEDEMGNDHFDNLQGSLAAVEDCVVRLPGERAQRTAA